MIEGEGSITIRSQYGRYDGVQVSVANTVVETVATCLRLVGDGSIQPQPRTGASFGSDRLLWHWVLAAHDGVVDLIEQIVPYLTGKRGRAEEALIALKGGVAFKIR